MRVGDLDGGGETFMCSNAGSCNECTCTMRDNSTTCLTITIIISNYSGTTDKVQYKNLYVKDRFSCPK